MLGSLKLGWNPVYESYNSFVLTKGITPAASSFYDAYPKTSEIFGAVLYKLIGNIEAGKSYTMLMIISTIGVINRFMCDIISRKSKYVLLASILLTCNVITINQCMTFYNDSFMMLSLYIAMIALVYISMYHNGEKIKVAWILLFMSIGLGITIKFSGLIHFGILCSAFYVFWIIKYCTNKKDYKIFNPIRIMIFFLGTVIMSMSILGASSYISNSIRYHNPLHSIIGENPVDPIETMVADRFETYRPGTRFLISLFSKTSNEQPVSNPKIKIPMTFSISEIKASLGTDVRISGWGIFFSMIFLMSIIIIFVHIIKSIKRKEMEKTGIIFVLLIGILLQVFIVPGLFMARYFLQLYIIPYLAVIILLQGCDSVKINRLILRILLIIQIANIGPSCALIAYYFYKSRLTDREIQFLKNENIQYSFYSSKMNHDFYGIKYNLLDKKINNSNIVDFIDSPSGRLFWDKMEYKELEKSKSEE
jgi:hypothetical protein